MAIPVPISRMVEVGCNLDVSDYNDGYDGYWYKQYDEATGLLTLGFERANSFDMSDTPEDDHESTKYEFVELDALASLLSDWMSPDDVTMTLNAIRGEMG